MKNLLIIFLETLFFKLRYFSQLHVTFLLLGILKKIILIWLSFMMMITFIFWVQKGEAKRKVKEHLSGIRGKGRGKLFLEGICYPKNEKWGAEECKNSRKEGKTFNVERGEESKVSMLNSQVLCKLVEMFPRILQSISFRICAITESIYWKSICYQKMHNVFLFHIYL